MKQEPGHNPSDSGYRSALDKAETPETDSNLLTGVGFDLLSSGLVIADFARKLERERDEARAAYQALKADYDDLLGLDRVLVKKEAAK